MFKQRLFLIHFSKKIFPLYRFFKKAWLDTLLENQSQNQHMNPFTVTENRYNDAAHYYFLLSRQCTELAKGDKREHFLKLEKQHLSLSGKTGYI